VVRLPSALSPLAGAAFNYIIDGCRWLDIVLVERSTLLAQAIKLLATHEPEAAQVLLAQLDDPDPDDDIGEL
jgi:hypothetical protein